MISINKFIKYLPEIILIVLLLFISVTNQIRYSDILICILFFIYFAVSIYRDISIKTQYSTGLFIIIIDILSVIALIGLCYLYFMNYDKNNVDVLWNRKIWIQRCSNFLIIMVPIKLLLENQRFKK